MWSEGLAEWFRAQGRHDLPWRATTDPWAVLVSEVMLQQTSVGRVQPRWHRFLQLWPSPAHCAAAPLDDVLREWQGLGYPRRARALWLTAARIDATGWPSAEADLRALPGVGAYTARALLAFSDLGPGAGTPPRDVNLGRVAARAALGREPQDAAPLSLDAALTTGRPSRMPARDYFYALFDVGAAHCRAAPRCAGCPLLPRCAARSAGLPQVRASRRVTSYQGSNRQLRGALLRCALQSPHASADELVEAVQGLPGASNQTARSALDGLVTDGLLEARGATQR